MGVGETEGLGVLVTRQQDVELDVFMRLLAVGSGGDMVGV